MDSYPSETNTLRDVTVELSACTSLEEIKTTIAPILLNLAITYFSVYSYKYYADTIYLTSVFDHKTDYLISENKKFEFRNSSFLGQKALQADAPFFWTLDILNRNAPIDQELRDYYISQNLVGGYCIPITRSSTARTIIQFGFNESNAQQPEGWLLHSIGLLINFAIMRLKFLTQHKRISAPMQRAVSLSKREVQTISWIALGKSSWETSKILGISEHTVNDHIERAVRKLKVSNRTEAVAAAIMTGQIDFANFDQAADT